MITIQEGQNFQTCIFSLALWNICRPPSAKLERANPHVITDTVITGDSSVSKAIIDMHVEGDRKAIV